jgi:hypothetical protein
LWCPAWSDPSPRHHLGRGNAQQGIHAYVHAYVVHCFDFSESINQKPCQIFGPGTGTAGGTQTGHRGGCSKREPRGVPRTGTAGGSQNGNRGEYPEREPRGAPIPRTSCLPRHRGRGRSPTLEPRWGLVALRDAQRVTPTTTTAGGCRCRDRGGYPERDPREVPRTGTAGGTQNGNRGRYLEREPLTAPRTGTICGARIRYRKPNTNKQKNNKQVPTTKQPCTLRADPIYSECIAAVCGVGWGPAASICASLGWCGGPGGVRHIMSGQVMGSGERGCKV